MKFYHQKIVEKVREERRTGTSIRGIHKKFNIPETTLSRWLRDIPSSHRAFEKARQREKDLKNSFVHLIKDFSIDSSMAKILLSCLYWCEGSKYPADNCVGFTNSDWNLVRFFLHLLRSGFFIREEKLRAKLQIHTTHNSIEVHEFWSKQLRIPLTQFHKPTITSPTFNMKRRNYLGTCTVKYYDVKLLLQITGIFETFGET